MNKHYIKIGMYLLVVCLGAIVSGCGEDEPENNQSLVMEVVSVDLNTSPNIDNTSDQLVISVIGNASNSGWTAARLIEHKGDKTAASGILEYDFVATPPDQTAADVITPITASLTLNSIPSNLSAVRVYSKTNSVLAPYQNQEVPPNPSAQPIYQIDAVSLNRVNGNSTELDISVRGTVSSPGWSNAVLLPVSPFASANSTNSVVLPPSDGIYAYKFYATPPSEPTAGVMTSIELVQRISNVPPDLKGVRIISATNDLVALLEVTPPLPLAQPIYEVTSIQLNQSSANSTQLTIDVKGNYASAGWSGDFLQAADALSSDGFYELTYMAIPPTQPSDQVLTPTQLSYTINNLAANIVGVRIFAASNSVEARLPNKPPISTETVIYRVDGVELSAANASTRGITITATGSVLEGGWSNPRLIPYVYIQAPPDGIYDFDFVATPAPAGGASAQMLTTLTTQYIYDSVPSGLKGVRIHASTNDKLALLTNLAPTPILDITAVSVSAIDASSGKPQVVIEASGNFSSGGWSNGFLQPVAYIKPPSDGVYEFTFLATPPSGPAIDVLVPTQARFTWVGVPSDALGVRVIAASNSIQAMIPGIPPKPPVVDPQYWVANVDYVEMSLSNTTPQQLTLVANGTNDQPYWSDPRLVAYVYDQAPVDGIYDFVFAATPPPALLNPVLQDSPISAQYLYTSLPDGFKGVRIHARNIVLTRLLVDAPQLPPQTVLSVTRAKVIESSDGKSLGASLFVQGNVSSGGWFNPSLVPVAYITVPQDGIYDITFVATPPSGPALAVISPVETELFIGQRAPDIKGYRIHASDSLLEFVFADPNMSPCDYVVNRRFETAQRLEGGLSIYSSPGYFWYINFNSDGTFNQIQSDFGLSGRYFCDANGFHMTDSLGNAKNSVLEINKERVGIDMGSGWLLYYYRVVELVSG